MSSLHLAIPLVKYMNPGICKTELSFGTLREDKRMAWQESRRLVQGHCEDAVAADGSADIARSLSALAHLRRLYILEGLKMHVY